MVDDGCVAEWGEVGGFACGALGVVSWAGDGFVGGGEGERGVG